MADTYLNLYRTLRLHCPELPVFLAQQFIRDRLRRIGERRPWSALRTEGQFLVSVAKTDGTVTVTRGSAVVTGAGTAFATTDVGRQFALQSGGIPYTVLAYTSTTSITLDRVYSDTTAAAQTYRIIDGYLTPPADFMRWLVVTDPTNRRRISTSATVADIQAADPSRTNNGQPGALVDRHFSSAGVPQYELWPYQFSEASYHYVYLKRAADLINDSDTPWWPLRGDELVKGAMADVCRWPGTAERPNLLFRRPDLSRLYEAEFEDLLIDLERQDEEIYCTWLDQQPWADWPSVDTDWRAFQPSY